MRVRKASGWIVGALFVLALSMVARAEDPVGIPADEDAQQADDEKVNFDAISAVPLVRSPVFQAPILPREPAAGKGRLSLAVGGNRQWCTYRDDRVVQPPPGMDSTTVRPRVASPIFTFGYQFTIAAVSRARPAETILLFESPVVRTAVLRQAAKLGRGGKKPPSPTVVAPIDGQKRSAAIQEQPGSIVPYWQEQLACTTLPETFDFDLNPGEYDVYMAFDILARSGTWTHRSVGFLTDVIVVEARQTRLDGRVDLIGGGRRQVELLGSALQPVGGAGAAP